MKHYVKLFSVLSTGTLLGCTQFALAPASSNPVAASTPRATTVPRVQPVERISSPVPEIEGLFVMARAAHGAGQLALAETRYVQVLDRKPSHLGALNSIAVIYAQTGRADKAFQAFKEALALDPTASHLHNNLGYALMLAGRLAEAESALQTAQSLNPSSAQTRQNLELLVRAKGHAAAVAGNSNQESPAETAVTGPQLVAVARSVYELRDAPAAVGTQAVTLAGSQMARLLPGNASQPAMEGLAYGTTLRGVRIEVSNGAGIRHLARRTAQRLSPMGIVTARLTNQPRFRQLKTEIQFGAGQQGAADALSAQLPITVNVVPAKYVSHNTQMRLVLGRDLAGKSIAAWLESAPDLQLAQDSHDGWRWS